MSTTSSHDENVGSSNHSAKQVLKNGTASQTSCESSLFSPFKRLVIRDRPYHQSTDQLAISNRYGKLGIFRKALLFRSDWFHVFLRSHSIFCLLTLTSLWTAGILIFAGIYMAIDKEDPNVDCGMSDPDGIETMDFSAAFAFSLETCTTVGYGLAGSTNAFFENCPKIQATIYFQMLLSMMFNAFFLSFIFARLARCENRAGQVLFGKKAIVRWDEKLQRHVFQVRMYDADSKQSLVEAHVRLYAITRETAKSKCNQQQQCSLDHNKLENALNQRSGSEPLQLKTMRIHDPNDDLGGMLVTSIPQVISHHIDMHSPIQCPAWEQGNNSIELEKFLVPSYGMALRELDSYTGGRDNWQCPVCGETYSTPTNLVRHVRYCQHTESHDDVPCEGSHQELGDIAPILLPKKKDGNCEEFHKAYRKFMVASGMEILCIVEAIDPLMSGTFHAMQSYTAADIEYDGDFCPCLALDAENKHAVIVDFDKFHDVVFDEGATKPLVISAAK